jgi:hypothetical protein
MRLRGPSEQQTIMPPPIHLSAVAGGAGGSWYVLMEGLARLVGEVHPEIRIQVVEGGGVSNHARVGAGEIPVGILNPPMTAAAVAGRRPYEQAYPALRIGVANLTTNYLHCFVERGLPLDSVASWLEGRQPVRMPVASAPSIVWCFSSRSIISVSPRPTSSAGAVRSYPRAATTSSSRCTPRAR